ncbi:fungal hydrophobin-domain-containing protein [Panaeolus papilionaceus]|nr:fungal hydrophobin-domain-containing protein [Panaeolus papilionaceus]
MRFSIVLAALPIFAAASAVPRDIVNSCNTGPIQCCNQVQTVADSPFTSILGLVGVAVGSLTGLIGANCSPITGIGLGGNSCSATPVCCTGNQFNGLINIGCSPINIL